LLCLLGEAGDTSEEKVWQGVTDPGFRSDWEKVVRPRRLLGAHTSLMGTSQVLGTEQPRLMDIIDRAIIDALRRHGHADPGVSASSELLDWLDSLQSDIQGNPRRNDRRRVPRRGGR
jgi:hypothetical protein